MGQERQVKIIAEWPGGCELLGLSICENWLMDRLAIFVDGGHLDVLARDEFRVRIDNGKLGAAITRAVPEQTADPLDLLRTYYDCLPYQSNPPTEEEKRRFRQKERRFHALRQLDSYVVREGRRMFRGLVADGSPIFQQKRVDLMLGLDFALLSGKRQITHAAVVSGDSDLNPAVEAAQVEGVSTWLFHRPFRSRSSSYAGELWNLVDRRFPMDQNFMAPVASPSPDQSNS